MKIVDILTGLKEGDQTAFRCLFDNYYDGLVLYAYHILNNAEAAEDVVQDCFVDLWVNKRFEHIQDGLDKYLFQAVKHIALNFLRGEHRRKRRHELVMMFENKESGLPEEEKDELEALYLVINRLPEERKKIFMMICLEGKKYQEVADILQISLNTVKTQMGRAFQFLRSELKGNKYLISLFLFLPRNARFRALDI